MRNAVLGTGCPFKSEKKFSIQWLMQTLKMIQDNFEILIFYGKIEIKGV